MKYRQKQWITTALIVLFNLSGWMVSTRVDYLIAQEKPVLLGRYTDGHLSVLLLLLMLSLPALYLVWSKRENRRERIFAVVTILIGLVVGIFIVDLGARIILKPRYVRTKDVYHRPPNLRVSGVFGDVPVQPHSYPNSPLGYPDVPYTMTIDARGFRNPEALEKCEVLVLGDSFAEGSSVSDDQAWPMLYGEQSGRLLYNLGMSGGNPSTYLETLEKFGVSLSPEIVLCMIYEGNDFRGSGGLVTRVQKEATFKQRRRAYFKNFAMRQRIKGFLIEHFSFHTFDPANDGVARSNLLQRVDNPGPLSWMPLGVPNDENANFYAFQTKTLIKHFEDRDSFASSRGLKTALLSLERIKGICHENNARLIVLFAPDKPHVTMPLVKADLDPEAVRAFLALKKKHLPDPKETKATLFANMGVKETAIQGYCRENGIEFVSMTDDLQAAVVQGKQAYYTYDQHWSPMGHQVVARTLYDHLDR